MTRDDERRSRASEAILIGGLPDAPGITAALRLTAGLGLHLRGLADELLVHDFPGATLTRAERELLATAVSAANDCFFCMDSHGAFATELLERTGAAHVQHTVDAVKLGGNDSLESKMSALLDIARTVRSDARALTRAQVDRALAAGATDGDTQLAVLIAAAFSMYNRMVDGFRAATPANEQAYQARAAEIADRGYSK